MHKRVFLQIGQERFTSFSASLGDATVYLLRGRLNRWEPRRVSLVRSLAVSSSVSRSTEPTFLVHVHRAWPGRTSLLPTLVASPLQSFVAYHLSWMPFPSLPCTAGPLSTCPCAGLGNRSTDVKRSPGIPAMHDGTNRGCVSIATYDDVRGACRVGGHGRRALPSQASLGMREGGSWGRRQGDAGSVVVDATTWSYATASRKLRGCRRTRPSHPRNLRASSLPRSSHLSLVLAALLVFDLPPVAILLSFHPSPSHLLVRLSLLVPSSQRTSLSHPLVS